MASFLAGRDSMSWPPPEGFPRSLTVTGVFTQRTRDGSHVDHGLEVLFASARRKPTATDLRTAHKLRKGKRASPVLVVAAYPDGQADPDGQANPDGQGYRVALCGFGGQSPPVLHDIEPSQAERLTATALDEPDRHAAERLLAIHLPELAATDDPTQLPIGVRNNGLLATHHLRVNVPARDDWPEAVDRAKPLLGVSDPTQASPHPTDATSNTDGHAQTGSQGPPPAGHRDRPPSGLREHRALTGPALIERLGFTIERGPGGPGGSGARTASGASLLTVNGRSQAVAVFCHDDEPFDAPTVLRSGRSPVETAIGEAERHNLDWVILTRKAEIRLYPAKRDVGVGRKGRAESFLELNLALLPAEHAGYLHLLFSAEALGDGGPLRQILDNSALFAADLAGRLRDRVYFQTVPALAKGVAARLGADPSPADLEDAYEQVMVILFRLLFVAYAEDKELLPYGGNTNYRDHSLKKLARRLLEDRRSNAERFDPQATSLWEDATSIWRAVDKGNSRWGVPAYNGGLFAADSEVFATGAALARMELSDADFGPALAGLLIDKTPEGEGLVDFRSLSVREFGTIYEGLLESRLAKAETDLAVERVNGQDIYSPAGPGDEVAVQAGEVYLHNRSGVRKATGSYFTKPFAVEHLLDHALVPALADHLSRLDALRTAGDDAAMARAFFDFRCADIAMGSGHFLVAALDRIEARLSKWLEDHSLPAVTRQLDRLYATATAALGVAGAQADIERSALLRRQVARHCVYGVDRQPVAVELARLAVWIHTFVPGLPLSFLDHNLVCGDSLTGVGSLQQAAELLEPDSDPGKPSFTSILVRDALMAAEDALERLALTSDSTKAEIEAAREAHLEARVKVAPAEALFDLATAYCADPEAHKRPENFEAGVLLSAAADDAVRAVIETHRPLHFPSAFPEVFLRERPGFDCLLGNPPWEEVTVERSGWWGRHLPGIQGQSVGVMNKAIDELERQRPDLADACRRDTESASRLRRLLRMAFPKLGKGDVDLHKAFGWRFWQLAAADRGRIGIVLPRSALSDTGNAEWRRSMLAEGHFADVTVLTNKDGWVFEEVHRQYNVSLCSLRKGRETDPVITLAGPFSGLGQYKGRTSAVEVPVKEFETWSDLVSFPLLPSPDALGVYRKLKSHPRLDRAVECTVRPEAGGRRPEAGGRRPRNQEPMWRFRPVAELHATADKSQMVLDGGDSARSANWMPPTTSTASSSIQEPQR